MLSNIASPKTSQAWSQIEGDWGGKPRLEKKKGKKSSLDPSLPIALVLFVLVSVWLLLLGCSQLLLCCLGIVLMQFPLFALLCSASCFKSSSVLCSCKLLFSLLGVCTLKGLHLCTCPLKKRVWICWSKAQTCVKRSGIDDEGLWNPSLGVLLHV